MLGLGSQAPRHSLALTILPLVLDLGAVFRATAMSARVPVTSHQLPQLLFSCPFYLIIIIISQESCWHCVAPRGWRGGGGGGTTQPRKRFHVVSEAH